MTAVVATCSNLGRGDSPLYEISDMTTFEEYVDQFGHHFSKKLYEFAVSQMTDRSGNRVPAMSKEQVEQWLQNLGVTIKNNKGHDVPYVRAMLYADCWGSSYTNDKQLALGIKDFLDDPDGTKTKAFDHYVIDCRSKDEPIFWDEMM